MKANQPGTRKSEKKISQPNFFVTEGKVKLSGWMRVGRVGFCLHRHLLQSVGWTEPISSLNGEKVAFNSFINGKKGLMLRRARESQEKLTF